MSSTGDPVICRTLFYEVNNRDNVQTMRFLPFCQVNVIGADSGKMFEPRDCMMSRQGPGSALRAIKTVHKIQEFNGRAKVFNCEQTDQNLHSFGGWDWPIA